MIRLSPVTIQVTPARYLQTYSAGVAARDHSVQHRLTGPFFMQQSNERGAAAYAAMQKTDANDQSAHFECYL